VKVEMLVSSLRVDEVLEALSRAVCGDLPGRSKLSHASSALFIRPNCDRRDLKKSRRKDEEFMNPPISSSTQRRIR
jgi:hypothetical protein